MFISNDELERIKSKIASLEFKQEREIQRLEQLRERVRVLLDYLDVEIVQPSRTIGIKRKASKSK